MIRAANPADAETIALHRYPDTKDILERPIYATWVADAMQRGLYLGFLVERQASVVAGAGLTVLEWGPTRADPQPWRARLVNVWTHPDFRRQGLARQAVQTCLNAAQERGITRVNLGTTDMARPLYQNLGFHASYAEMTVKLQEHLQEDHPSFPKSP